MLIFDCESCQVIVKCAIKIVWFRYAECIVPDANLRTSAARGRVKYVHPDCGFWMLKRNVADGKIRALVQGRDLFEGRNPS